MRGRHVSRYFPDSSVPLVWRRRAARLAARVVARAIFARGAAGWMCARSSADVWVVMQRLRWNLGLLTVLLAAVAMSTVMVRDSGGSRRGVVTSVFLDARPVLDPFLIELQERTFRFFWDTANPKHGLIPDRYPTPSFSSIAAVGFGLTTYPIGVERRYVTREAARQRVLATLRFFHDAPQGPSARGVSGYKGFFYHYLDMKTGERFEDSELSTVDTAILLAGVLFCQSYFDGSDPEEVEIRDLAEEIYRRV